MPRQTKSSTKTTMLPPARASLPPFEALRAFDAVARLGGVRKAAKWLERDHAVISRHLRSIEDWLGIQLVERTPYGISLTATGEAYHKNISKPLDTIAQSTLDILNQGFHNRLHIYSVSGFALYWLSEHLGEFEANHKSIEFILRSTPTEPDFSLYEADVDIRLFASYRETNITDPLLRSEKIAKVKIFPVASPKYIEASETINTPIDLLDHQLLHEENYDTWTMWLSSHMTNKTFEMSGTRFGQGHLTLDAARHGRGIALANSLTTRNDIENGILIDISKNQPSFAPTYGYYTLFARRDRWNQKLVRSFRSWLKFALKDASE